MPPTTSKKPKPITTPTTTINKEAGASPPPFPASNAAGKGSGLTRSFTGDSQQKGERRRKGKGEKGNFATACVCAAQNNEVPAEKVVVFLRPRQSVLEVITGNISSLCSLCIYQALWFIFIISCYHCLWHIRTPPTLF
jgi:hypothetical protein